jgi:hypothetical protein
VENPDHSINSTISKGKIMHNIVAFSGWLMRKWFGGTGRGLVRFNRWWTLKVREEPGEAFVLMILIACIIFILSFLPALLVLTMFGVDLVEPFMIACQVIWVGNYLRIIVLDQYDQFRQEQDQIIDKLKGKYR